jgi:hypothetical protein
MRKRRSIEVYLKQNVPVDDYIYKVWKSLRIYGYPQSVFRKALLIGINKMIETGEILPHDFSPVDTPSSFYDTGIIKNKEYVYKETQKDTEIKDNENHNSNNSNVEKNIDDINTTNEEPIIDTNIQKTEKNRKMGKFM